MLFNYMDNKPGSFVCYRHKKQPEFTLLWYLSGVPVVSLKYSNYGQFLEVSKYRSYLSIISIVMVCLFTGISIR
ncbi:hypothetical protein QNI19_27340 [Cytophagaceae bacterium DM2B3-1]|uniref:Uncharacterized protein n=1 Tax=Xanthocytophaga flava TaxID=3048013 RepID=A0ABT7CSF3_9BACT|nr:hypothetical protein [Xanthocytophaga flavus]MDJ1496678.1 hypothetical protein [Xanthocytophaga flavus]